MKRGNYGAATNAVELAYGVIDLHRTAYEQAAEIERLREFERKYNELIYSSLEHAKAMAGNQLRLLLQLAEKQDETR